ncbi:MAG: extracellular solute-binding protein family 5, partial [Pseudomonas sp.]|nr:extracellular solute-binding protein family 5 [Pseudomonas sp.]
MHSRNRPRLSLLAGAFAAWLTLTSAHVAAEDRVFDVVAP